ncbi:hypothetical protein [Streptomyces atratus]|uniref:hypothetical protein n=1 Tax=Streptomyces atratus TaxID=1893 RepID=UPI00225B7218|nr:hypothetical protein [Streptomyces atratus]MCX5345423.1 hypothetical protein [Streptomyces atratus]
MMGWYFLAFDDQLDGEVSRDPRQVAAICSALIGIVRHIGSGLVSPATDRDGQITREEFIAAVDHGLQNDPE